jgi:hypothetical protein
VTGEQHADTVRRVLDLASPTRMKIGARKTAEDALDALLAESQRLRDALTVYATASNWAISRDDLAYRVVSWIGPGAERDGMPDAMQTAREALRGGDET